MTDIAEVDVYRGANGAKLGMGAMSGAVVVKFKEPEFTNTEDFKVSGFANSKFEFLSKDGNSNSLGANLYNNIINISLSGSISDYNNYEIAKNRINILKRSVDSAQNVLDSYTRLFLAGKRQWLDLVNASREVMQYKIELSNLYVTKSILSYKLALKNGQIDLLTGEIK